MIADSAMPKEVHEKLMKDLLRVLTEEQVPQPCALAKLSHTPESQQKRLYYELSEL